ncbi:MAG: portal protein [Bdellovibrionales bacterium]|nr:portal protein [Bdellovibrionales bacterium]
MMSYHELIGRALEIYTEEAVNMDEKGEILKIFSENERVREELHTLFYNNLKIHTNLPVWTYQTIKYGDCFLHLDLDDEKGIVDCKQLPAIEIERIESDYAARFNRARTSDDETVFRWKSEHLIDFKYWTIAHFRLLLDETRLPYGVSILEKCRRLWKNLLLAEDAMISLQLIRGIDRLVYYVEVGNLDPDDVTPFIEELANKFKRTIHVDPQTGQIDLKHNILGIDQDIFIPKRGNNDGSRVDKIEGQANMDTSVVDILTKKLIATLGVPMPYLSYEEMAGEGKTLSMQDIRFARTTSRIQQAMIMEMNKIAMIHLILVGLEDEVNNFSLGMNNPSIQAEMLRIELLAQKVSLYRDAIDFSSGIAAMSVTKAKQTIFNMTDDEIKLDLQQQRIERAAYFELEKTDQIIPKSGMFDDVDSIYGNPDAAVTPEGGDEEGGLGGGSGLGGGGGLGGDITSGLEGDELGGETGDETQGEDLNMDGETSGEGEEDIDLTTSENEDQNIGESLDIKLKNIIKG